MDAYDRCNKKKKNLADSVAIYGRGREIFRPPMYVFVFILKSFWTITKTYGHSSSNISAASLGNLLAASLSNQNLEIQQLRGCLHILSVAKIIYC
jgi:hypothetical protein